MYETLYGRYLHQSNYGTRGKSHDKVTLRVRNVGSVGSIGSAHVPHIPHVPHILSIS